MPDMILTTVNSPTTSPGPVLVRLVVELEAEFGWLGGCVVSAWVLELPDGRGTTLDCATFGWTLEGCFGLVEDELKARYITTTRAMITIA